MRICNFVIFDNLIYIKLYSLLIYKADPMLLEHSPRPLAGVYVYKTFVQVFPVFIELLIKNIFFKSENSEKNKIMICWIHYVITKLKN